MTILVYLNQNYKTASLSLFLLQYGIQPALSVKLENIGAKGIGGWTPPHRISDEVSWHSTKHSQMIIGFDQHPHVHRVALSPPAPPIVIPDTLSCPWGSNYHLIAGLHSTGDCIDSVLCHTLHEVFILGYVLQIFDRWIKALSTKKTLRQRHSLKWHPWRLPFLH